MKRLDFIEIAKGIGIILVILGHSCQEWSLLYRIIYSFHMPLFFLIAGYLYNAEKYNGYSVRGFVKKKWKSYMIPYFIMGSLNFVLFAVLRGLKWHGFGAEYLELLKRNLFGVVYSIGWFNWMPNCSPIWFLTCIFCAEILLFLIMKYTRKPFLVVICMAMLGLWIIENEEFVYLWNLEIAMTALLFLYVGYCIRKYQILEKYKHWYSLILLAIAALSFVHNDAINLDKRMYGNAILTYLGGISLSVLVLYYSKYLRKLKLLRFYGSHTMVVMGYNYAMNYFAALLLAKVFDVTGQWKVNFVLVCFMMTPVLMYLSDKRKERRAENRIMKKVRIHI